LAEGGLPSGAVLDLQHDRMLVLLGSAAVEFLEVLAGQALIWGLADRAGRYSGKVQQPLRIWPDWHTRPGTVTCGDRHWWTCCLVMACKRPGVRVPLAPQFRDIIRNPEPRLQDLYSSKVPQREQCEGAAHQFGSGTIAC